MAHLGCFVAAEECTLSVVDRVFTRIGASDRILENKSTFFVELEETKAICDLSTESSLVILDELGRGTSTFDGYAIAHSVLSYLCKKNCRTLFTTHYHMLAEDFKHHPDVRLFRMSSEGSGYKFEAGAAEHSYGLNVAKMAGINSTVLALAKKKASKFEE